MAGTYTFSVVLVDNADPLIRMDGIEMRAARLLTILAIFIGTLSLPTQQWCATAGQAQGQQRAIASPCCGTSGCCPQNHCSCAVNSPLGTDDKSVAAPVSVTDGSLSYAAPVATTNAPSDAGPAARLLQSDPGGPTPCHAFCRSNRAPPQS